MDSLLRNAGNKKPTLGTNEIGNTSKNIKLANYNLIANSSFFNKGDVELTTRRALLKREAFVIRKPNFNSTDTAISYYHPKHTQMPQTNIKIDRSMLFLK